MRRTILLADDSPTIQRLVTQTFADADFDVISVSNGEAAIRKFDETPPDVVLADIYMPGKNGYEVCAHVKAHPSHSGTPVILLVGAFDAFDEDKAKEAGAISSITKPFEPRALVELVTGVIDGSLEEDGVRASRMAAAPQLAAADEIKDGLQTAANPIPESEESDLLGLDALFAQSSHPEPQGLAVTDADIERIADRVIEKLSSQVIESIAWEIVPDITEKVLREELKRNP